LKEEQGRQFDYYCLGNQTSTNKLLLVAKTEELKLFFKNKFLNIYRKRLDLSGVFLFYEMINISF
jgi:hypothetical protein